MSEVGTLAELGVKVGDVVIGGVMGDLECVVLDNCEILVKHKDGSTQILKRGWYWDCCPNWCIISRATPAPKLWRDMTPEEKGALLLAAHEGKEVQATRIDIPDDWRTCVVGIDNLAYRIKTESKIEVVTVFGAPDKHVQWCLDQCGLDTHRITFNLIDGKPDCASVKMECI